MTQYKPEELFPVIKSAALMLSVYPWQEILDGLKREREWLWLTDPTLQMQLSATAPAANLNMQEKLLKAAADFVRAFNEVHQEATGSPFDVGTIPPSGRSAP